MRIFPYTKAVANIMLDTDATFTVVTTRGTFTTKGYLMLDILNMDDTITSISKELS